jgi:hypothetical protein
MPDTRFIVFPRRFGNLVDIDDSKTIVLDMGEIRIFMHAGADFDEENIRQHCNVLVKGIKQIEDSTKTVAFASYVCERCLVMCKLRLHLANHIRTYKSKDSSEEEQEGEEQSTNDVDEGVTCKVCRKHFANVNSYYQHKRRARRQRERAEESSEQA